jgi:nicotinamidase-related amidase
MLRCRLLIIGVIAIGSGCAGETITNTGPTPGVDIGAGPGTGDRDPGVVPESGSTKLGIVVIDVQQEFVQIAANANITQIIDNTKTVFELAERTKTQLFITYEGAKQGTQGLPAQLRAAMPDHAREFIKTTFAATGLPAFASAVGQAGLTHVVVLGAETDVCVLQTALGLRSIGFVVILQQDAVFTSEPNTGPALRRMQQAGVVLAGMPQVRSYIEGQSPVPVAPTAGPVKIIKPLKIAALLAGLTDQALDSAVDPFKTAKLARLRELLLISEWFDIPLYGTGAGSALPAQLQGLITKQIHPVTELTQGSNGGIQQVVLAGIGTDQEITGLVENLGTTLDIFILEDGLISSGSQVSVLDALYTNGAVPLTYKSLYYGMTKSVDLNEWPSQAWVGRDPIYYPKTKAPEDLPPVL